MRILAVDMGTGTQDILLFDSSGPIENSVKLVMPSATTIAASRIRRATEAGQAVLLTGVIQGGGPCHWALEDHLKAGVAAYATPQAARTFDDDLERVQAMGVRIVSDDEAAALDGTARIVLRDLDLDAIRSALAAFDLPGDFDGLALGCLDHGNSPPDYSDRLFRFDHLRRVVEGENDLLAFAYLPEELPEYLTRARTMLAGATGVDGGGAPVVFLDTGPAAALGALQDPQVAATEEQLVLNLGNMHALAFHLRGTHIYSLYEHHTGEMTTEQIEDFTERLIAGTLAQQEVFDSKGHGVFYADQASSGGQPFLAVTGPQRGRLRGSRLQPYFATPHGDMMISGCFGLVLAFAARYPQHREEIERALAVEPAVAGS
ncbi:MAG: pyruvate formate lyase-activating protein [Chloroflexi bacterium]|nr:pyruvate formate lyase-activating protein [Chloroflexota bacterium]